MGGLVAAPLERAANSYVYVIVAAIITAAMHWLLLRSYIRGAAWWVLVTVAGQVMGFQATASFLQLLATVFELDLYATTAALVIPQSFLFGVVVGSAQWLVLRRHIAQAGWWILACAVGWAIFGPVARDVGAALAGIVTGVIGGAMGAAIAVLVLRKRLSHSGLWVLAAVVAWAVAWIAALAGSDAAWQTGREVLSGALEGAALSAVPGVALVLILRRPVADNLPPFEWRLWLRWVLFSAGSAALIGLVLGIVIRFLERTIEEEPLLGQGVFLLLLFTATAMAIGAIQWQLLRQRLSLAGLWGLGSALGFLVLGFLWLMQLGGSGALAFVAGGLVAGLIQWAPMRRSVPWGSRWILISTLGVALVGPVTILAATLLGTLATLLGAAIVSYAILGAIVCGRNNVSDRHGADMAVTAAAADAGGARLSLTTGAAPRRGGSCASAKATYSGSRSMPRYCRPSRMAATGVVPLPTKQSSTTSPGAEKRRTTRRASSIGELGRVVVVGAHRRDVPDAARSPGLPLIR